jgi:hypothetical protein
MTSTSTANAIHGIREHCVTRIELVMLEKASVGAVALDRSRRLPVDLRLVQAILAIDAGRGNSQTRRALVQK